MSLRSIACAVDAYAKYVERIGKHSAPMVADFDTQVRQGLVYVSVDDRDQSEGFIVFYSRGDHMHLENIAVALRYQVKESGID